MELRGRVGLSPMLPAQSQETVLRPQTKVYNQARDCSHRRDFGGILSWQNPVFRLQNGYGYWARHGPP
jgi:hypothetical protein